jgi:CarboxypepD_reg-like domain
MQSSFRHICFVLLVIVFSISPLVGLKAQVKISGCITQQNTTKPLPQVIIQLSDGSGGDVSDDNGCFEFEVEKLPVDLIFRLIGYETARVHFVQKEILKIVLTPSEVLLPEIQITNKNVERFAGNERRSIWDYAWMDNQLLLCEYGSSLTKSRVILMNTVGDTLATSLAPARPESMFNDCGHFAYLMSRDSLWEYYIENGALNYFPAQPAILAERVLQYCVGQNSESIYFAVPSGKELRLGDDPYAFRYESNNDKIRYYLFDRQSEKLRLFKTVTDEFTLALKKDEMEYGNGPQPKLRTESASSTAASKYFFWKVMCKEVDAPMYHVRDSLFILDHANGKMEVLDADGEPIRSVPIHYHLDPTYLRQSIMDESGQNLYALFEEDRLISLQRIDLSSGKLLERITIPHIYPEHITISGAYIYYLCRDEKIREAHVLNRLKLN